MYAPADTKKFMKWSGFVDLFSFLPFCHFAVKLVTCASLHIGACCFLTLSRSYFFNWSFVYHYLCVCMCVCVSFFRSIVKLSFK